MCDAVSRSVLLDGIAKRSPRSSNHARWLTSANIISIDEPSQNLITLVEFVIMVYIPVWSKKQSIRANGCPAPIQNSKIDETTK